MYCHVTGAKGEGHTRGAAFGLGAGALEYRVGHLLNKLARVDRVYPPFYAKEYSLSDFKIRASSILSPSCSCLLQALCTDGLHSKGPPLAPVGLERVREHLSDAPGQQAKFTGNQKVQRRGHVLLKRP